MIVRKKGDTPVSLLAKIDRTDKRNDPLAQDNVIKELGVAWEKMTFKDEVCGTFSVEYKCYSVSMMPGGCRMDVEKGGKIIFPSSGLDHLTKLHIQYPMVFKLENKKEKRVTHCGVYEFVANEGHVYLPYWMMNHLLLEEGSMVHVEYAPLGVASYVKFEPQSLDFYDICIPKRVLADGLRFYSCLTTGDIIPISFSDKVFKLKVVETKPDNAVYFESGLNAEMMDIVKAHNLNYQFLRSGQSSEKSLGSTCVRRRLFEHEDKEDPDAPVNLLTTIDRTDKRNDPLAQDNVIKELGVAWEKKDADAQVNLLTTIDRTDKRNNPSTCVRRRLFEHEDASLNVFEKDSKVLPHTIPVIKAAGPIRPLPDPGPRNPPSPNPPQQPVPFYLNTPFQDNFQLVDLPDNEYEVINVLAETDGVVTIFLSIKKIMSCDLEEIIKKVTRFGEKIGYAINAPFRHIWANTVFYRDHRIKLIRSYHHALRILIMVDPHPKEFIRYVHQLLHNPHERQCFLFFGDSSRNGWQFKGELIEPMTFIDIFHNAPELQRTPLHFHGGKCGSGQLAFAFKRLLKDLPDTESDEPSDFIRQYFERISRILASESPRL